MSPRTDRFDRFAALRPLASGTAARVLVVVAVAFASAGCYDQILGPNADGEERVTITNDEAALAERMRYTEEDVPIDSACFCRKKA